jgi:hypothetical protein
VKGLPCMITMPEGDTNQDESSQGHAEDGDVLVGLTQLVREAGDASVRLAQLTWEAGTG